MPSHKQQIYIYFTVSNKAPRIIEQERAGRMQELKVWITTSKGLEYKVTEGKMHL